MKWKYETEDERYARETKWHRVFIWRPLKYKGVIYWLMYMERRSLAPNPNMIRIPVLYGYENWEYREPLSEFESLMRNEE